MDNTFETKAGKILEEYSGDNVGIVQIKYLTSVLTFCKQIDQAFMLPMPLKDVCKKWNVHDWGDYIDAVWAERNKIDDKKSSD